MSDQLNPRILVSVPFSRTIRTFWNTRFRKQLQEKYQLRVVGDINPPGEMARVAQRYPEVSTAHRRLVSWLIHVRRLDHIRKMNRSHGLRWYRTHSSAGGLFLLWIAPVMRFFTAPLGWLLFRDSRIRQILIDLKPAFVILNCPDLALEVLLAAESTRLSIPLVYNVDGYDFYNYHPILYPGVAYLVHSAAMRRDALRRGLPEAKLVNIPNYIYDVIEGALVTKLEARAKLGVPPHHKLIVLFEMAMYISGNALQRKTVKAIVQAMDRGLLKDTTLFIRTLNVDSILGTGFSDYDYLKEVYGRNPNVIIHQASAAMSEHDREKTAAHPYADLIPLISAADFWLGTLSHGVLEFGFFGVKPIMFRYNDIPGAHHLLSGHFVHEEMLLAGVKNVSSEKELIEELQDVRFDSAALKKRFTFAHSDLDRLEELVFSSPTRPPPSKEPPVRELTSEAP